MKQLIFAWLILSGLALNAQNYKSTYFYVSSHPDDWQLFSGIHAWNDISNDSNKVVFIYITAGDAGLMNGQCCDAATPYYLAREKGAKYSVEFIVNSHAFPHSPYKGTTGHPKFNNHSVLRYRYLNTTSYFLRLPDGSFDGTLPFSLQKFYNNEIDSLQPVDQSTTYANWNDLITTVTRIISYEKTGSEKWIRYPDPNPAQNPNDNSDHLHTGLLIQSAIADFEDLNQHLYKNYITGYMTRNLDKDQTKIESGLFAAYCMGITLSKYPTDWIENYTVYLDRDFYRVIEAEDDSIDDRPVESDLEPDLILNDCYPNPAFDKTEISFHLNKSTAVTVSVFDIQGRLIKEITNAYLQEGDYALKLDVSYFDDGMYIVRVNDGVVNEETTLIVIH